MKRRLLVAALALLALALGLVPAAQAQLAAAENRSILDDPEWRKSFLGSYGFLSGAEPDIRPSELEILREVIDLMKVNPRAAGSMLRQQVGPESSAALDFVAANLDFQNGDLDSAVAAYQTALAKFPDFRRAHKNLGLVLVQRGDHAGGAEHLARALELGDRDGRTYGLIGYCYLNLEKYLAAEQAYRSAILQQPDVKDWKLGLARALLAIEKHREAVALFDQLLAEDPDDANIWLAQANAYLGLDDPRSAAVNLEAVRMLGGAGSQTLTLLGDIYMNEGMTELARDAYLEVIEKDAQGARFQTAYRAAELLIRSRAWDDAQAVLATIDEHYGKKLTEDQELRVLTLQAKIARAKGRSKEAAKLLESIVRRDGTRGDALLELAAYYQSQGQIEQAILAIERAQNVEAYEYQALLAHAQLEVSQKDYTQAAALLRKAIAIKREPRVEAFLERVEQASRAS